MDDLLLEFLTETAENLQKLDSAIVELERKPGDRDLLRDIFRTIHTVKGTCGFLGLERLERVAHSAENVLVLLRDGELAASPRVIGDVLASVDVIRSILDGLEASGEEPTGDDRAVIASLDRWTDLVKAMPAGGADAAAADVPTDDDASIESLMNDPIEKPVAEIAAAPAPQVAETPAPVARPAAPVADAHDAAAEPTESRGGGVADASLRVNVAVLDRLMNMVGELVLTRNQLLQLSTADSTAFMAPVQQLNRVTTDLQEAVMKTRMQPVSAAWTKLPRLVRDLTAATGKPLDLEMHGATTELDRQVLQAIQDPLTHLVRNAADHGIEAAAARRAAGKSERGRITLNAYHEGGHVVVEVSDDGAGIDAERVRRKAVERGLITTEAANLLSDAQVLRFIFEAGFSTAPQVTSVSGRGVGMDVVKSNIERIGGTVDLKSRPGQGCTVQVRIPLTLAIVPALIVRAGDHAFAVPQVGVVELVRVGDRDTSNTEGGADAPARVERVGGARLLRLRDTMLPLVRLANMLHPAGDQTDFTAEATVVVCQVGAVRFGVEVDEVYDTQDIVVKPVGRLVRHLDVYAGCTILGDGRVIMILDAAGLADRGKVAATAAAAASAKRGLGEVADEPQTTPLLLFEAGGGYGRAVTQRAVPLSMVSRLEEIPSAQIEFADGQWLVQYRGSLLPLIPASPDMDFTAADPRPVIVFRDGERAMGLAVDAIHDIVETTLRIDRPSHAPELLGVAVVDGRTTEVVDIQHYLRQTRDNWFAAGVDMTKPASAAPTGPSRVLVLDDSTFFLGLLGPLVRSAGFHVTTSPNGAEALARLDRGEMFDLILSDIDMPHVDGFVFAQRVRERPEFASVPMIALTGRTSAADEERAFEVGFSAFLPKLDRDVLLAEIRTQMATKVAA